MRGCAGSVCSTDPTQKTCARWCRLCESHPVTWAYRRFIPSFTRSGIDDLSALKNLDHELWEWSVDDLSEEESMQAVFCAQVIYVLCIAVCYFFCRAVCYARGIVSVHEKIPHTGHIRSDQMNPRCIIYRLFWQMDRSLKKSNITRNKCVPSIGYI